MIEQKYHALSLSKPFKGCVRKGHTSELPGRIRAGITPVLLENKQILRGMYITMPPVAKKGAMIIG